MNTLALDDGDFGGTVTDEGNGGNLLGQIPVILADRKWLIAIPTAILSVAGVAAAFLLPTTYESSATLLVQAPSLPTSISGSEDDAVAQRIEGIRQQIVNRPALLELIQRNGLYPSKRKSEPLSKTVETMRDAIELTPQTVDLGGKKSDQTIAFRLAYTYENPVKAQAVAQELTEQLVEVDSTSNAEQLTQAVQFLTDQQRAIQQELSLAEADLSAFNTRYGGILSSSNMAMLGGGAAAYDLQISNLQREIADLEAQKRLLQSADSRDPAVVQAEAALAAVRAAYTDNHPDVVLARQRLEQARAVAKTNVARFPGSELDVRLNAARGQMAALQAAKMREAGQTSAALAQRSQSPAIQAQAAQLQQRVAGLNKQYDDISNRLLTAKGSQKADEEQMGERLLVVDPPVVPDRPISPNRPLIVGGGILGGLALGFLLAIIWEIIMRPIRDPAVLYRLTGAEPLGIVPVIEKQSKLAKRSKHYGGNDGKRRWRLWPRRRTAE